MSDMTNHGGPWRRITGYRFDYRISEKAQIQKWDGTSWVDIKARLGDHGKRLVVNLRFTDGSVKQVTVTHLMANAFMGGLKPGQAVIHKDRSKFDCSLENLQIVTQKQATDMSRRARRRPVVKVDRSGEILAVYSSAEEAAKKEHYCAATIRARCNGLVRNPWRTSDINFKWER